MSVDWQTASERLNRFVRMDAGLRQDLARVSKDQARDDKIAFKLEEGRVYGLRQQYYENRLARDLGRKLHGISLTEQHW